MIGFFRRIRKKLADDNQFFKYSRYAVGEILLVVVGILIALSINNWNTKRLEKIEERNYLGRLIIDLKNDLDEIKGVVMRNQIRLYQCKIALDSMGADNIPYNSINLKEWNEDLGIDSVGISNLSFGDVLTRIRMYDEYNNNDDTYSELLANGKINIIRYDELRVAIIKHYSYLENRLQLVKKIEMMRDNYVETLAKRGISMYNTMSYQKFDNRVKDKKNIIAEIENIFYITRASQIGLRYGDYSVEWITEKMIEKIEDYLNGLD
jgi:hypothetical protein